MPKKYDYTTIVIDADSEIITYTNGHINASTQNKHRIKEASTLQKPYRFIVPYGEEVPANINSTNIIEITAALLSAVPGRSIILEAPQEVWDWLDNQHTQYGEQRFDEDTIVI